MAEISLFFKDLCSSTLRVENLVLMAENIIVISNKLEKILPPGFFNVMEHLPIHLVHEALLGGPVHYRWMYPYERTIGMSKRSIKNKNRVEGCIVESYLAREGSHFYSYYFDDQVSCLRNRPNRHADTEIDPAIQPISIFNQPGKGSKKRTLRKLTKLEKKSAALHILLNCPEVQPFLNYFVSQHGHDQVYPLFTTWYTNWMVDKGKGKSKKAISPKKKIKLSTTRRPIGVVIAAEPARVNIPPRASVSATGSAHQAKNASTHVAPASGYTIFVPNVAPRSRYQTPQGYSHLGSESTRQSASNSNCNNLNTISGSLELSDLHLGSNGSERNTPSTQESDAHVLRPGDRDSFRRLIVEPIGYRIIPDEGLARIILKCIGTHYDDLYLNWGKIPMKVQGQMFNEFKKYYVWAPEHEEKIQANFNYKAGKLLAGTFCECRRHNRIPTFMVPDQWAKLQKFWNTDEKFKKRSNIGQMARASDKGGSLHTGGAISQLTRKKRMEKELGRPVPQEELFKVTHTKKMTDPTEGEKWIEPRAQETYERFMQKVQEYRSTLPMESQDAPLSQEITEQLWRKSAGEPVRGVVYGYTEKAYHEKKAWFYCASSSNVDGVDKATMSKMEDKISLLTAELAAVAERERKRDEQIAADSQRYEELRAQLNSLFDSEKIIPPGQAFVDESEEE